MVTLKQPQIKFLPASLQKVLHDIFVEALLNATRDCFDEIRDSFTVAAHSTSNGLTLSRANPHAKE